MKTSKELYEAWREFLDSFIGEEQDIFSNVEEGSDYNVEIIDFLGSKVNLNDSYGFLTLDFRKNNCPWNVQDFLAVSSINFNSQKIEEMKLMSTTYSEKEFPCRVYGADNKGRLRFYQSEKIEDLNELFESFVTVLRSVCNALINLKIQAALK